MRKLIYSLAATLLLSPPPWRQTTPRRRCNRSDTLGLRVV